MEKKEGKGGRKGKEGRRKRRKEKKEGKEGRQRESGGVRGEAQKGTRVDLIWAGKGGDYNGWNVELFYNG